MIESNYLEITPAQRRQLRASAHHLNPVVSIGQKGLQPSVLAEIDRSLKAHELIKVRLYGQEREARLALCAEICTSLNCAEVQQIGNLLVLWRKNPEAAQSKKTATSHAKKSPANQPKKMAQN